MVGISDINWISKEAQEALEKSRYEQQRISQILADARAKVWPLVKKERECEIITADIMNMRFY